jgi:NADP-dependent 3-hydroxy acid dehydrogenase YdfG
MKIVLITGATSGFGLESARLFAKAGWRVIATGRRDDRLTALKAELLENGDGNCRTLCFDIRDQVQTVQALLSLPEEWREIDVLINNAGLARGRESFEEGNYADWKEMIDTNVLGILHVSSLVVQWMKARESGTVINVGSIAGREAYSGGNIYSATKFAVHGLTQSMRIDLAPHGIRVAQIAPGAADTEFSVVRFHGNIQKANQVYQGFEPLRALDVAETIFFMATRPAHVNIADVVILPAAQATASIIHRKSIEK